MTKPLMNFIAVTALFASVQSHALYVDEANSNLISSGELNGLSFEVKADERGGLYARAVGRASSADSLPSRLELERVCYSAIIRAELDRAGQKTLELSHFNRERSPISEATMIVPKEAKKLATIQFNLKGLGNVTAPVDYTIHTGQSIKDANKPHYRTMICAVGNPKLEGSTVEMSIPRFSRESVSRTEDGGEQE